MAHDVFISHSSKDKPIADAICAGLEARGIRCWIAPRDILPGQNYAGQIFKAIGSGKIFLLVLTGNSTLSAHILKEVELAVQSGITILPFRVQDVPLSDDLKYYLSNVHWLDALTPPVEKHIGNLADFVNRLLDKPYVTQDQPPIEPAVESSSSFTPVRQAKHFPIKKVIAIAAGVIILISLMIGSMSGWFTGKFRQAPTANVEDTFTSTVSPTATSMIIAPTSAPSTSTSIPAPPTESSIIISTKVSPVDGMIMVYVPAGNFLMGSSEGEGIDSEYPRHEVFLDAFWIDQTEVTGDMYEDCVKAGGCTKLHTLSKFIFKNYPVVKVDWDQAQGYCEWAGRRLPTEAEWEKAARGPGGNLYPWGNEFDCSKGNFDDASQPYVQEGHSCDGFSESAPVGSFPDGASPYGALDMAGNVWEWVADWYGSYSPGFVSNPTGPSSNSSSFKVLRGGSWLSDAFNSRSAARFGDNETLTKDNYGFRCAAEE